MTPSGTLPTTKLQFVDRWMGVPACFLLTLARKIFGAAQPPQGPPKGKILFVKLAEMGSTVLAYAAIRRAVEMVGRENVFFVVFAENRFILDLLELIPPENVFAINAGGFRTLLSSALETLRRLRAAKFEAAVDLEFFARSSAAFTFLTGARRRVGFHTFFGEGPYRGDLMTHRLLYNPYLHTSQIFASMVVALEADPRQLPTFGAQPPNTDVGESTFRPRPEEVGAVREIIRQTSGGRGTDRPLILLNANASDLLPLRRWEPSRYVALAKRLLSEFPEACVVFTGAPGEAAAAELLVTQVSSERCFSLAGKTSLRQLLVLYTLSELLITNDSGPAHFASLTPTHVVTLFGPETPRLFAARTPRNVALYAGVSCSPCVNAYNNRQSPCRNNVCMQQITVEQVFAAACETYRGRVHPAETASALPG